MAAVQSWSSASGYTTVASRNLTVSGATANNLLVLNITLSANAVLNTPTGWTLIDAQYGSAVCGAFYRIATGDTNDNVAASWAAAREVVLSVEEYSGLATTAIVDSAITKAIVGTGVKTIQPAAVTPSSSAGLLVSFIGCQNRTQWLTTGPSIDSGGTRDIRAGTVADYVPLLAIGSIPYTSTASIQPTWSTTDSGGPAAAVQVCFREPAAAGVALSGNAANESTATGTANFTIPIAGASVSLTTASATITAAIPFAGDVASVTDADGNLSLSVGFHGSMLSDAVASALLSSSSPLSGSAGSQAGSAAALSVGSGLVGSASSEAEAVASISSSSPFAGSADAETDAAAVLSVGSGFSGSALADAMASGALSLSFSFDGAALSEAMAAAVLSVGSSVSLSGDMAAESSANSSSLQMDVPVFGASASAADADGVLATIVPLEGAGASVTAMLGSLDVGIGFDGRADADAMANGMMTFRVNLSADAVAQAAASGLLSGAGDLESDARYLSPFHSRDYVSQHKPRAWVSSWN